jgi:hypothetical protein
VRGFLSNTELFRIMMAAYGWEAGGPGPEPALIEERRPAGRR